MRATITIDTSELGEFILNRPRQMLPNNKKPGLHIVCKTSDNLEYSVAFDEKVYCRQIQWDVTFQMVADNSYDASTQQNIYSPKGWWLLFEWDSFPRIPHIDSLSVCAKSGDKTQCQFLPTLSSPPLLFVWGQPSSTLDLNNSKINIYIDSSLLDTKVKDIEDSLNKQYLYLKNLFTSNKKLSDHSLVWVSIDKKHQVTGGASGNSAYIVNYIVDNQTLDKRSIPVLLRTSAHEVIHMISDYTFPIWMSESLAEYYAYKSLLQANIQTLSPIDAWNEKKALFPHAGTGLYEAHVKVSEYKAMQYYPLFYLKGATFWFKLDEALYNHAENLDNFIELLDTKDKNSAYIPAAFEKKMIKFIGSKKWNSLSEEYLY